MADRASLGLALTGTAAMDLSTSMPDQPAPLRRWHAVAGAKDPALLDDLLAEEVVFQSPAVFAPQAGKALTISYLSAALTVLGPSLRYVSQWHDHASAVLEFEADLDGVYVQGVDILRWNAEEKLVSFTVMVRPLRGLQKLAELMAVQLAAGQPGPYPSDAPETRARTAPRKPSFLRRARAHAYLTASSGSLPHGTGWGGSGGSC
jgi:hypothetical protein